MHVRDITPDEFETISTELTKVSSQGGAVEVIRGQHHDHGTVVIIRDLSRYLAMVEEPAFIDMMQAETALMAEGAAVAAE